MLILHREYESGSWKVVRNGFVPSGEASHAVPGITRRVPHAIPDSPAGFLEASRSYPPSSNGSV
jgi:hypothetical protein